MIGLFARISYVSFLICQFTSSSVDDWLDQACDGRGQEGRKEGGEQYIVLGGWQTTVSLLDERDCH